jgi:hypothetical protein
LAAQRVVLNELILTDIPRIPPCCGRSIALAGVSGKGNRARAQQAVERRQGDEARGFPCIKRIFVVAFART